MAKIIGKPDEWPIGARNPLRYAGPNWFFSTVAQWSELPLKGERFHELDLSQIDYVTLFEWVSTLAIVERVMADPSTEFVGIDLIGAPEIELMAPQHFISAEQTGGAGTKTASFVQSNRVYNVAGFLESLGTLAVLNLNLRGSRASYPWVGEERARLRAVHTRREDGDTIVMSLCRISSKDDCRQFLDEQRIVNWRETMSKKFRESPLFEYEELWRVFCHELAVNVFEHAKTAGFLAGRVVLPHKATGEIRSWCEMTYRPEISQLFPDMKSGFLELCVSDAGKGFLESLGATFRKVSGIEDNTPIRDEDLLAFAFDELGTSKLDHECWATSRHALGRILQIVAKYGGALTLRSGRAELLYVSRGGPFERIPGRLGYRPQYSRSLPNPIPGAHFQLILPLVPFQRSVEKRDSILVSTLPDGFHHDTSHVHGHFVPLLERLGTGRAAVDEEERSMFRGKCEALARELISNRPANEVLVLDFSNLQWTASQFETLLYLLQNVLQHRLVLLVEIAPDLARDVVEIERDAAATFLDESLLKTEASESSGYFSELSEKTFLETYRCVHSTVLGIDTNSNEYIFGLPDRGVEKLLLGLIDKPRSFEDLCRQPNVNRRALTAIFHNMNPLFQRDEQRRWRTVWDRRAIATETRRAMSRWFDEVAIRCEAWWGGQPRNPGKMKFNLPWQDEWVSCFFEAARILTRQRHADEAAQRLIFRLEKGLQASGKSLSEVGVLACVTAPAILLATALHRWWPASERPAVADLGPYLLLHDDGLPLIAGSGGIVIVQDVLDRKLISARLVERLKVQKKEVFCILSLAQLVDANDPSHPIGATNIDAWDTEPVRTHAMINLERPPRCEPANDSDEEVYWVEPRTLRPFNYNFLRRKRKLRIIPNDVERPDFFTPKQEGVLCAGHYVYGERHYTIALDIRRAVDGVIGNEVSAWLAKICIGSPDDVVEGSPRGHEFSGAVTAVLMPLHSQIHYLWPTIENLLAQRGRRQPMWLLDATLFLGHGAAYRLPLQFQDQVYQAILGILRSKSGELGESERGIRLLIVDDAMVRARTAETILAEIDRAVRKARENARKEFGDEVDAIDPIEWIRYFVIFDQMGNARHQHWRQLTRIGHGRGIPFLFNKYAWISGVPDYEESNCPACAEIERLQQLAATAMHAQADVVRVWAEKRIDALRPVAIDAPGFQKPEPARLTRPIDLLALSGQAEDTEKLRVFSADEAILRFYELNYLSYPPNDFLRSLQAPNAWPLETDLPKVIAAYERFRWAVLGWCLQKWPRLVADSAREAFLKAAEAELEAATPLTECLFEGMARHRNDELVKNFIVSVLCRLAEMEGTRWREKHEPSDERNAKLRVVMADSLTIFLLSIPPEELRVFEIDHRNGSSIRILDYVGQLSASLTSGSLSLLGGLHLKLTRPHRFAEPSWALHTIAETLLRGREPNDPAGSHQLLPWLLSQIHQQKATLEKCRILQMHLSSFLAALDDLARFSVEKALPIERVKTLGNALLSRLIEHPFQPDSAPPSEVKLLLYELEPGQEFCVKFDQIFHHTIEQLKKWLEERAAEHGNVLEFEFRSLQDVKGWHVLTESRSIVEPIANWAIDAAKGRQTSHKSRIEIRKQKTPTGQNCLQFRILTNFETLEETNKRVLAGRNFDIETRKLKHYGAVLPERWDEPSVGEAEEGFTSVFPFTMPAGSIPKQKL